MKQKIKLLAAWPFVIVATALLFLAAVFLWPLCLFLPKPNDSSETGRHE